MTVIVEDRSKADEISNEDLKAYREHRREHRGERFVDVGREVASDGKTIKKRKRVENDHRLQEMLGEARVEAMSLIRSAFMMVTNGLGLQTFNPFRTPCGGGDIHAGAKLMEIYWSWTRVVKAKGLDLPMCLATVVEGKSLNECAASYNRDKRTVAQNLVACLDAAMDLRILQLQKKGE